MVSNVTSPLVGTGSSACVVWVGKKLTDTATVRLGWEKWFFCDICFYHLISLIKIQMNSHILSLPRQVDDEMMELWGLGEIYLEEIREFQADTRFEDISME